MIFQTVEQLNKRIKRKQELLNKKWRTGEWKRPVKDYQKKLDKTIKENQSPLKFM